ncbi:aspartoacylase [Nostoc linckia z18]|jgi:aspartoacylase|uniref:Probable aspartoacylase n=2 Tax=Nostoc linckia TaxID=92942 RepID=A0A9Q5ZEW1_NOSLI|nr:aspartoacylase [Nostoc linckia]PHK33375.1 aspartoacylase [Nostoc linckia z15]PHK47160.1 aspartoacylase [Nostoc linckia z16]PHJ63860.1 aspartoacylase [Nostoc linckia z1]PHJ69430.1 aspartoacylase [Nostoc linckia z3]PHJ74713.1 aspartoacylase [Nostoc linckia z2]
MSQIKRVAIVGGTHGNELTGVYLVKKFQQYPNLINRPSWETLLLLGNLKAIAQRKRYIDKDLNRCFSKENLQNSNFLNYEDTRAQEIKQILQPQNQPFVDVIIDLHSTTANMGLTLIFCDMHPFLLRLAAYLTSINSLVKVYINPQSKQGGFLRSVCELGFVIEVGAVAQNVLNAELFQQTEQLIYAILEYFTWYNQGHIPQINNNLTFYEYIGTIDYPRDEQGEIQAMIHPQVQFRDYEPLNPGEPIFRTFADTDILYEGVSTVYPIFINEAAYYEKGIAMHLTQKQQKIV